MTTVPFCPVGVWPQDPTRLTHIHTIPRRQFLVILNFPKDSPILSQMPGILERQKHRCAMKVPLGIVATRNRIPHAPAPSTDGNRILCSSTPPRPPFLLLCDLPRTRCQVRRY